MRLGPSLTWYLVNLKHVAVQELCPLCKTEEAGRERKEDTTVENKRGVSVEEAMHAWKPDGHGGLDLNREYFAKGADQSSASRAAQETVRSRFAAAPTVELTFAKQGQQAVHMIAKTDQILGGQYNDVIDRNAAKGFTVSVSAAEHGQKVVKQQEQSQATGLGFGS
jgi:hypothetical protein